MGRSAFESEASDAVPQSAPVAATPRPAAGTAGQAGSREALAKLNAAVKELKAFAIQPMLNRALAALNAGDHRKGETWALKALDEDERCGLAWYILAFAREKAGDFASSLKCYEAALALLPDEAQVANDLGRLAYRMGMAEQSEKLFRHYLARHPGNVEGSNNLATALRELGRYDEAIEVLRTAIEANPGAAILWNALGAALNECGDLNNAQIFFEEALRLEPKHAKARYNLGNARLLLGDAEGALADCEAALKLKIGEDERQMMRLSRSTTLIALGRIREGWDEYEARLHPQFAGVTIYNMNRPKWEPGADIKGRAFLVIAEQGLGDEVLFSNLLEDVQRDLGPDGKLYIAVEYRLVSLFQRSFPDAVVGVHKTYEVNGRTVRFIPFIEDTEVIDLWAPMGSLLRQYRAEVAAFPNRPAYLTADPDRIAHWRRVLETAPPGPKIGLLWKSAVTSGARHRFYAPFKDWRPVLTTPGATFVNLQYGDCSAEIEAARRDFGVDVWTPPGIDLKVDLDDIAALCCAMDLVIGHSNATFNLGAACGAPSWLISVPASWPRLGCEKEYPWYSQVRVFAPKDLSSWDVPMAEVGEALRRFVQER